VVLWVATFIEINPSLAYAMYSAIGLYGVYMDINQEELNDFLVFVRDHPDTFVQEAISTEDFKKGFVITLGEFLSDEITPLVDLTCKEEIS